MKHHKRKNLARKRRQQREEERRRRDNNLVRSATDALSPHSAYRWIDPPPTYPKRP